MKNKVYIHYKSGVAYKVIEDENFFVKENGQCIEAVMFVKYGIKSNKKFIESKNKFNYKFMFYGEDTQEIYDKLLKNKKGN